MGAVYLADQISLERRVALKLLPKEMSQDPAATERFRREARALAKLNHPNIVAVHDFGETPDGSFFFVMERVEGTDLHQLIRQGNLAIPQVLNIVRQVCDALEYAHGQGFVHRDIKPANILVDPQGRAKVSDFGVARFIHEDTMTSQTRTGGMVGTPEYVAPEQRAGNRPVDHRADIFSLGVMLYEMLTGSLPRGVFEPPSHKADVDAGFDRVVRRAMQEEPEKRYQCAADVKQEVDRTMAKPSRFRKWRLAALLAAGLVGGTALAAVWHTQNVTPEPVPPGKPAPGHSNSRGMQFLPFGRAGLLLSAKETTRQEFALFAEQRNFESALIYFPSNGNWQQGTGAWNNLPGVSPQGDDHAVVGISQKEAAEFARWLTENESATGNLKKGEFYRLPTAEEWAEATRLPLRISTATESPWSGNLGSHGSTGGGTADPRGFYNLHDNVVEWTSSRGQREGDFLACGRGWADVPETNPTAAAARSYPDSTRGVVLGFRLLLDKTNSSPKP
jgi:serine/threonine protein kinase